MKITMIEARDLPDLWFQAVYNIFDHGHKFTIDQGSYEGQTRLEYDYFIGHIKFPGTRPLLPDIPPALGIPNPVDEKTFDQYLEKILTPHKAENEAYTYGERLIACPFSDRNGELWTLNQLKYVIDIYKEYGHRNNQLVLQIARPEDLLITDPPCLRSIDTRIQDNKLHFFIYFRSWSLWGGLPANIAAIQTLKEYMAHEIGVDDGEMIVESKGLHLYGFEEEIAKIRCMK